LWIAVPRLSRGRCGGGPDVEEPYAPLRVDEHAVWVHAAEPVLRRCRRGVLVKRVKLEEKVSRDSEKQCWFGRHVFQRDRSKHGPEQLAFRRCHDHIEARFSFDQLEGRKRVRKLRSLTPTDRFQQRGANVRHRDGGDVTHEGSAVLRRVRPIVGNPERA
jgi:hypothetical protein